jgi:hypothetical protein
VIEPLLRHAFVGTDEPDCVRDFVHGGHECEGLGRIAATRYVLNRPQIIRKPQDEEYPRPHCLPWIRKRIWERGQQVWHHIEGMVDDLEVLAKFRQQLDPRLFFHGPDIHWLRWWHYKTPIRGTGAD